MAAIHNPLYYRVVRQGSETAEFHECMRCQLPVFASATVDEQDYAVINASCVANPRGFGDSINCRVIIKLLARLFVLARFNCMQTTIVAIAIMSLFIIAYNDEHYRLAFMTPSGGVA